MKIEIKFYELKSDHIFASPEYDRSEFVTAESLTDPKIAEYLATKNDWYGNTYETADKKEKDMFGFDFMSLRGAAKVVEVVEPVYTSI